MNGKLIRVVPKTSEIREGVKKEKRKKEGKFPLVRRPPLLISLS